jgi:hypothetical protein
MMVFNGPGDASSTGMSAKLFNWWITSGLASQHPAWFIMETLEA